MSGAEEARPVGVIGAGTMGRGIAQVAATAGRDVVLVDADPAVVDGARASLAKIHDRLVEKGRVTRERADAILGRITGAGELSSLADAGVVIEAVVESLEVKKAIFGELDGIVAPDAILATNTSSLPVVAIASACRRADRCVGLHFFNPAPLLPLVEVVPALTTDPAVAEAARALVEAWGKVPVIARDTPGFIVNRIARPFYGESLRIHEESIADPATIDHALKSVGGFRMGPFELMDLIGNDVNVTVTRTVFEAFHFDPRYRPSFAQQRMAEAGYLGRKSGRGWYDYAEGAARPEPARDIALLHAIVDRVVAMLVNEAADALFWGVASAADIDLAMQKGVNYPKGLLAWGDEIGADVVLERLEELQAEYGEDRYRPSPLLRRVGREGTRLADARPGAGP